MISSLKNFQKVKNVIKIRINSIKKIFKRLYMIQKYFFRNFKYLFE